MKSRVQQRSRRWWYKFHKHMLWRPCIKWSTVTIVIAFDLISFLSTSNGLAFFLRIHYFGCITKRRKGKRIFTFCDIITLTDNAVWKLANATKFTNQWCMLVAAIIDGQPIVWTMTGTRSDFTHWTCHNILTTAIEIKWNETEKHRNRTNETQISVIVST